MSKITECPSPELLHRALSGELSSEDISAIEQHLLECGACAMQTLYSGELETYTEALQGAAKRQQEIAAGDSELLERLISRLRNLRQQRGQTLVSDEQPASLESELVQYFHPPSAAGELGWLGGYRVLRLLGAGGMGGVFLAEDTQLNRQVALKVMRPDILGRANSDDRFLREARAAAAVHHDHIVTIYQVGRDGQVPYLAMEFLEGESLDDRLHREPVLPLQDVLRIGREIAVGLAAAHARGLVHRDIKPANIWLAQNGVSHAADARDLTSRVKLLDFGLARSAEANFELTSQGAIIGTPAFMAPEQARGDVVDHRADLFSLGIVLYRMATGALPFLGKDAISTLVAIGSQSPDDPRKSCPDLPAALADLILKLLSKNPDERPGSASEVVKQLSQISVPTVQNALPVTIQTAEVQPRQSTRSTRLRWIVATGVLFLTCLLGGIITIRTDGAYVELRSTVDDVDVSVKVTKPDGTVVETIDLKTGSKFTWFWSGRYEAELVGGDNSVELTNTSFTLKRGSKEVLTLKQKPVAGGTSIAAPIRKKSEQPEASPSRPILLSEPPSLIEWLNDRKVLTVAQDGSGQFKTIQAALNALQPGEAVKVLDKGPYRERLDVFNPPMDCGLISEVQTILEAPDWKPQYTEKDPATGGEITVYAGHLLAGANAFRLHGFEMQFPPSAGKTVRRLSMTQTRSFTLENCLIHASESFEGEPIDIGDWNAGNGVGMNVCLRDCVIEGSAVFTTHYKGPDVPERQSSIVVQRNYFQGVGTEHHLMIVGSAIKNLAIRCNVFAGNATRDILLSRIGRRSQLEVSNNTLLSQNGITFGDTAPQVEVTIRNNLHAQYGFVTFHGDRTLSREAARGWSIDHNAYPELPVGNPHESILSRPPGDHPIAPRFYSKVPQEANYLRISPDEQLATAGAGGAWPSYIGALPPGPVPNSGDWFSRLRARCANSPVQVRKEIANSGPMPIPDVPTLVEWLEGREVVTVAQDGSGQHQTISAAIRAMQTGQVIKVLDRGPYKEHLRFAGMPANTGLISNQQTVIEVDNWNDSSAAHEMGPMNGFRLSGFCFLAPRATDWTIITNWIQPVGLVIEDCFFGRQTGKLDKPGPEASIQLWFNASGGDESTAIVRNCLIDGGAVGVGGHHGLSPSISITQNYFRRSFVGLQSEIGTVLVKHNVFESNGSSMMWIEKLTKVHNVLEVSNNTVGYTAPWERNSGITFVEVGPKDNVIIRNNITDSGVCCSTTPENRALMSQRWQMDHNAYVREWGCFPKSATDLLLNPKYLSSEPHHPNAWRVAVDSELARGGAGGAWPSYIGAFRPGPAPADGDWFTRVRDKWASKSLKK